MTRRSAEARLRDRGMTRRAWLSVLAAAAGTAPLVQLFGEAIAQEPASGLARLVAIYMPHGMARELWRPREGFDLGYENAILSPFSAAPLREQLLVIEGLDLREGIGDGSAGHEGARCLFTGSSRSGKTPSIDQFLAIEQGLGASTVLPSLTLGVGQDLSDQGLNISYARGGVPVPKLIDPSRVFDEVIGRFGVPENPEAAERARLERKRGQSMLDALRGDLNALAARAGASEKEKLEHHTTALRALERRLSGFELACEVPPPPDSTSFPNVRAAAHFDRVTDLMVDLIVTAFQCDVTRFATLFLSDLSNTGFDPSLPDDVHIDVAHRYAASSEDGSESGEPETWLPLAMQNRYSTSKVARLVAGLDQAGLLPTSLVVASSDMGDPARHSSRQVPTLLAGGTGAGIRHGRHLDVRVDGRGLPNNRLMVSICRAFGVAVDAFGDTRDPATAQGALELG